MSNGLQNVGFVMIDGYPIDITLSENHVFDSDVTDFPVETGADITDNIRPKPITVSFDGIVSDTPLNPIAKSRENSEDLPQVEAYLRLQKIRNDRLPVQITTSLDVFNNMALKTLTIPRAANNTNSLQFKVTFVQITQVQVARVSVPILTPPHQGTGNGNPITAAMIPIDLDDGSWFDPLTEEWWNSASRNAGPGVDEAGTEIDVPSPPALYILTHDSVASVQFPRPNVTFILDNPSNQATLPSGKKVPFANTGPGQFDTVGRRPANIIYISSSQCKIV